MGVYNLDTLFPYCIQLPLDTGDIKGLYARKHRLKSRVSAGKAYTEVPFPKRNCRLSYSIVHQTLAIPAEIRAV